jgi:hypothetical protein
VDQRDDRKQAAYQRILSWNMPDRGDVSAAKAITLATWLAVPTTIVVLVVGWLALDWTAHRAVVTSLAAVAGPAVGLATVLVLCGRGSRKRLRTGLVVMVLEGLVLSWVVLLLLGSTRPTATELRSAFDHLDVPYAEVPGSEQVEGNRRCKPTCTLVARTYRVQAPAGADPPTLFLQALNRDGWEPPEGGDLSSAVSVVKDGIDMSPAPTRVPDEVRVEATTPG